MDEVISDELAMRMAIAEAYKGAGFTSPNPLVGCVVLSQNGKLLGKGFHQKYGQAHAEMNALRLLSKEQLQGARIFVTLEPCAHIGKTPSCAQSLAKLPIHEVIIGLIDPNPLVSGKGVEILKRAGIRVQFFGKMQRQLEKVCEHFLMNIRYRRPFVTLKVASSLDGQLAHKNGESKWITGEASRNFGHYLRATHEALLVGKKTILIDNPKLNIRHPRFKKLSRKLIILDPNGEIASHPQLNIWQHHEPSNILIVSDKNIPNNLGFLNIIVKQKLNGALNLNALLSQLYKLGIHSILVEGGAQTISAFINQKEANRLYLFQAPVLIGGRTGKSWSEEVIIKSMQEKIQLNTLMYKRIGDDIALTAKFPELESKMKGKARGHG